MLLVLFFVLLSVFSYFTLERNKWLDTENNRLKSNQNSLNDSVEHYRTLSGKTAVSTAELIYTLKELKAYQKDNVAVIKDLGLKLKQVQSVINTGIVTVVKDTLVLRDTVILNDTVRCFKKFDEYIKLLGCVRGDSVVLDISHVDTITSVAHWTYRKWWIFKCKTDVIRLESVSKSPYSRIFFNEYIKIVK